MKKCSSSNKEMKRECCFGIPVFLEEGRFRGVEGLSTAVLVSIPARAAVFSK